MSKTLKLKEPAVPAFTEEQAPTVRPFTESELRAMLADIEAAKPAPAHIVADKSALPPPEERTVSMVQAPAKVHGSFSINGIPVMAPGININPSTGFPNNQVVAPTKGGSISPPPTRNFRGS